jgi:hypothetical protein
MHFITTMSLQAWIRTIRSNPVPVLVLETSREKSDPNLQTIKRHVDDLRGYCQCLS